MVRLFRAIFLFNIISRTARILRVAVQLNAVMCLFLSHRVKRWDEKDLPVRRR